MLFYGDTAVYLFLSLKYTGSGVAATHFIQVYASDVNVVPREVTFLHKVM